MARQGQDVESEAFQHYLHTQRNFIDDHDMGLRDKTLDDKFMASITNLLEHDATRAEVITEIRRILAITGVQSKSADNIPESSCSEIVTHAARLLTMVKVGPLESEPKNPQKYVTWNDGTLRQCLDEYFFKPVLSTERVRLPKVFDAWAIERLAGIRISFTDNLADHLRLEEGDDQGEVEVLVFHHASVLQGQGQGSAILPQSPLLRTSHAVVILMDLQISSPSGPCRRNSQDSCSSLPPTELLETGCSTKKARLVREMLSKCPDRLWPGHR